MSLGYHFIFCYIWLLNVLFVGWKDGVKSFVSREKIGQIITWLPGGSVARQVWPLRLVFFIACFSPLITATLVMADFCLPPVAVSSQGSRCGQRFPGIPLLIPQRNILIIVPNLGHRTMNVFQKGRNLGDIQLLSIFIPQTFQWLFHEMQSTQVTGIQEK